MQRVDELLPDIGRWQEQEKNIDGAICGGEWLKWTLIAMKIDRADGCTT